MYNDNSTTVLKCESKSELAAAAMDVLMTRAAVSGYGQYHTANPESKSKNIKPYVKAPWGDIISTVRNPHSIDKTKAQWAIFSTTGGPYARVHQFQRDNGQFFCTWGDLDDVQGLTMLEVIHRVKAALPDVHHAVYSSRSAQEDLPKSRVLVPFSVLVPGADYSMIQEILNDRLEKAGLPPDRASERPGQLCYLPNRGEFYQYQIIDGPLLDPYEDFKAEIEAEQARLKEEQQERERRHRAAIQKAQERINTGQANPVDAFRQNYPVELALENYGYARRAGKYLSPLSESGNAGVTVRDGKWHSHHNSDAGIRQPGKDVGAWGDAFDLFVYYEHGGDFNQAVKAAGEMFTTTDPGTGQVISITKANQREYMRQQNTPEDDSQGFQQTADSEPLPPFPLERVIDEPEPYPMDALGPILGPAAKKMNEVIQAPDGICAQSVLGFAAHVVQGFANVSFDGRVYPLNELSVA